jgi:hypothetical protein
MGVRAAIAESFERIHRSNLVMMGIIPLEFMPGETMASLGLTGQETFTIRGLDRLAPKAKLTVEANSADGQRKSFQVLSRVDDPTDLEYVRQGGSFTNSFGSGSQRANRSKRVSTGTPDPPGGDQAASSVPTIEWCSLTSPSAAS